MLLLQKTQTKSNSLTQPNQRIELTKEPSALRQATVPSLINLTIDGEEVNSPSQKKPKLNIEQLHDYIRLISFVKRYKTLDKYLRSNMKIDDQYKRDIRRIIESPHTESILSRNADILNTVCLEEMIKISTLLPNLSVPELRICYLLRQQFSTKEIATIFDQTVESVKMTRSRIRKKIGLTKSNECLIKYLFHLNV